MRAYDEVKAHPGNVSSGFTIRRFNKMRIFI